MKRIRRRVSRNVCRVLWRPPPLHYYEGMVMQMELSEEWLNFLREQFPEGSRVQFRKTANGVCPVKPGSAGILTGIDNSGQFHVTWTDGQSSRLTTADQFWIFPPEPKTLRFYMPLTADLFVQRQYSIGKCTPFHLDSDDLRDYEGHIAEQMVWKRMPEEAERGLMHWYDKPDSVAEKVLSAVFNVESREEQLWGVVECRVIGTLSPVELETIRDYLFRQSRGEAGKFLEQQEIGVQDGNLYVHIGNGSDNWTIETEEERFGLKIAKGLPPMCFSVLESAGKLIGIERGGSSYHAAELDTGDRAQNEAIADRENAKLGVTPEQRMAMEIGSLCDWDTPGADPKTYEGRLICKTPPSPQKAEGTKKRRGPSR